MDNYLLRGCTSVDLIFYIDPSVPPLKLSKQKFKKKIRSLLFQLKFSPRTKRGSPLLFSLFIENKRGSFLQPYCVTTTKFSLRSPIE